MPLSWPPASPSNPSVPVDSDGRGRLGDPHPGVLQKEVKLLILKGRRPKESTKRLHLLECKELSSAGARREEVICPNNMRELII